VIDTIWNLLFRCQHRRTTFPLTLARDKGAGTDTHAETYVVCLDCGKQFLYDWEHMRLGGAVNISGDSTEAGTPAPAVPFRTKSKMRYLLWGSAISAAVVLGKTIHSRRRTASAANEDGQDDHKQGTETPGSP